MGKVAVTLKVMPEGKEVDLNQLKEKVKSQIDPRSIEEESVAFGLRALKAFKTIPDDAGGSDKLEDELKEIEEVKNVKVTDQRKLI